MASRRSCFFLRAPLLVVTRSMILCCLHFTYPLSMLALGAVSLSGAVVIDRDLRYTTLYIVRSALRYLSKNVVSRPQWSTCQEVFLCSELWLMRNSKLRSLVYCLRKPIIYKHTCAHAHMSLCANGLLLLRRKRTFSLNLPDTCIHPGS